MDDLDKRFAHSSVLGHLIAPMRVTVNEPFQLRLDLTNVAKKPAVLVKVEGLAPAGLVANSLQPNYSLQNGSVDFANKTIGAFKNEVTTLIMQADSEGIFTLEPQCTYLDDSGQTKTSHIKPITITVQQSKGTLGK
jgi:hypothetical protein